MESAAHDTRFVRSSFGLLHAESAHDKQEMTAARVAGVFRAHG
jgi:hypothetical protein